MSVQPHRREQAFGAEADRGRGFRAWAYATEEPAPPVPARGCFNQAIRTLQPGDLIWLGLDDPPPARPWEQTRHPPRRMLLMVAKVERGQVTVRVVMDLGTPEGDEAQRERPARPRREAVTPRAALKPLPDRAGAATALPATRDR